MPEIVLTEIQVFAHQVMTMLELQKKYFKSGKDPELLGHCLNMESSIRRRCRQIIGPKHPDQTTPLEPLAEKNLETGKDSAGHAEAK